MPLRIAASFFIFCAFCSLLTEGTDFLSDIITDPASKTTSRATACHWCSTSELSCSSVFTRLFVSPVSSALVRLHGPRRGSLPQRQQPPSTDSGHKHAPPAATEPVQSPPEQQQQQQQQQQQALAPPADIPGRYSFASDAPAYLRQTGRSTSMADLRDMPHSLPPRRWSSTGEPDAQPSVLGRSLRDRQSPPEERRSPPSGRKSPTRDRRSPPRERRSPPKNSGPKEVRQRITPPARERQGRSPSRNRRSPSRDQRDSSRSRRGRGSSRDRRDSSRKSRRLLSR